MSSERGSRRPIQDRKTGLAAEKRTRNTEPIASGTNQARMANDRPRDRGVARRRRFTNRRRRLKASIVARTAILCSATGQDTRSRPVMARVKTATPVRPKKAGRNPAASTAGSKPTDSAAAATSASARVVRSRLAASAASATSPRNTDSEMPTVRPTNSQSAATITATSRKSRIVRSGRKPERARASCEVGDVCIERIRGWRRRRSDVQPPAIPQETVGKAAESIIAHDVAIPAHRANMVAGSCSRSGFSCRFRADRTARSRRPRGPSPDPMSAVRTSRRPRSSGFRS